LHNGFWFGERKILHCKYVCNAVAQITKYCTAITHLTSKAYNTLCKFGTITV
jgi:hypothetical protein